MNFDQLLGAARTQKLVELVFQQISSFFVNFKPFSVISQLKSTKNIWKWTKKVIFVFSSKLVDSLRGYLEIFLFWLILNKKAWKRLKKSCSTSFWVRTAPKSQNTQQFGQFYFASTTKRSQKPKSLSRGQLLVKLNVFALEKSIGCSFCAVLNLIFK